MGSTATYTDTGHLTVTADATETYIGAFDADGGEWIAPVDAMLAEAGWRRTGDWTGDDAPVVSQMDLVHASTAASERMEAAAAAYDESDSDRDLLAAYLHAKEDARRAYLAAFPESVPPARRA